MSSPISTKPLQTQIPPTLIKREGAKTEVKPQEGNVPEETRSVLTNISKPQ